MISFNFYHLLQILYADTVTLGVRASRNKFGGDTGIQSITPFLLNSKVILRRVQTQVRVKNSEAKLSSEGIYYK